MATIGSIAVNLSLNTGMLESGVRKASSVLGGMGANLGSAFATVRSAVSSIGAGAIASAFGSVARSIDDTADAAGSIGISASNLQKLHLAGQLNGASAESMDGALRKMVQTMGDAARGAEGPTKALNELGINVNDIINLGPAEQFLMLSDGFKKVGNEGLRASLITDIFGKSGQVLNQTLQLGAAGLQEVAAQANAMGYSMSNLDVKAVQGAVDQMDLMNASFEGVKNSIVSAVAPMVEDLLRKFNDAAAGGTDWGMVVLKSVRAVAIGFSYLKEVWNGLNIVIAYMRLGVVAFGQMSIAALDLVMNAVDRLFNALSLAAKALPPGIMTGAAQAALMAASGASEEWHKMSDGAHEFLDSYEQIEKTNIDDRQAEFGMGVKNTTAYFDDQIAALMERRAAAKATIEDEKKVTDEVIKQAEKTPKVKEEKEKKIDIDRAPETQTRALLRGSADEISVRTGAMNKAAERQQQTNTLLQRIIDHLAKGVVQLDVVEGSAV